MRWEQLEIEGIFTHEKDVHTEHCCYRHGCCYGDQGCTVKSGMKPQSYPCEVCDFTEREAVGGSD